MIDIFLELLTPTASRKGKTSIVRSGRKGGKQGERGGLKEKGKRGGLVLGWGGAERSNMEISPISRLNRVALNGHGGNHFAIPNHLH
jgi:hypothetical protein